MSFSSEVKQELAKQSGKSRHCQIAELAALVAFEGKRQRLIGDAGDVLDSENPLLQEKYGLLLTQLFQINIEEIDTLSAERVLETIKMWNQSFGGAQITDTVNGILLRKKHQVVYLKEGAQIVDMLNIMEAHVALMNLENVRILKEMRNSVNRKVNCETANISKTVTAAVKQLGDIEYIKQNAGLDSLPENLKEMALLRLEYPDTPLKELGTYLDPPVGKSGVNHRLRRISEIADELRGKEPCEK